MISRSSQTAFPLRSALALTALLSVCCAGSLQAADEPQAESRFDFSDTDKCLLCHGDVARMKDHADFVGVAPAEVWGKLDKHSQSFLLLRDKSRELTNHILGFDLREVFADDEMSSLSTEEKLAEKVQLVKSCLRCHATWPVGALHPTGKQNEPVVDLKLGVSCQGCHGPASEWNDAHAGKWWRRVSKEAKSKLGFTDLRDTVVKAEICTSCHVGSMKEERFVRHEWYAAGHPPLPGFELASFSAQMPAHWQPLAAKADFDGRTATSKPVSDGNAERILLRKRNIDIPDADIKANYQEANFADWKPGHDPFADQPRTKEVLVSAAVVLRSHANLAGGYSAAAAGGKQAWPEFSLYDCAACHHELRRREGLAERPVRRGAPGRPPLALWPSALLRAATEHVLAEEPVSKETLHEFETNLRGLDAAYTSRPFGDPKKISAAAKQLSPQLDELCRQLRQSSFEEVATRRAIALLASAQPTGSDLRDYATARQIAWAIRELSKDVRRIPYGFGARLDATQQQAQEQIDRLFRQDDRDPLMLSLPARQDRFVVDELPASLRAMFDYDAEWFREHLTLARELIEK